MILHYLLSALFCIGSVPIVNTSVMDRHPSLKAPFSILADEKPIETFRNGGAYGDLDGDEIKDLVFGTGSGIQFSLNSGTNGEPLFTAPKWLEIDGQRVSTNSSPAISTVVQLVDFNKDGHVDILAGPSQAHIFWGSESGQFKQDVLRAGRNSIGTGRVTSLFATDWDLDGDYDIIHGNNMGRVALVENTGDVQNAKFSKAPVYIKQGEDNILIESGTSTPVHQDWDGDGLRDLVIGGSNGEIVFYKNVGTDDAAEFRDAVLLISHNDGTFEEEPLETGKVTIPTLVDYNVDGQMDLLVGDHKVRRAELRELNDEESKIYESLKADVDRIASEQSRIMSEFRIATRNFELDSPAFKAVQRGIIQQCSEIEGYQDWSLKARQMGEFYTTRPKTTGRLMVYLRKQRNN